ncbi:multidrug effflux MFS transporter [Aliivibrio fischeri]|uniref:multidrug effflux MFS transporter n=1 Tax=Aliivibrio fischeri TaxID=668 RepID=UPI00084C7823|nr:multidrug effflux MFS transporter [Aliivibrio fischeri]OED53055.1 Bcr/CflA family drug resistance efflux transporter [Aliivibrio fischeri]
MKNKVSFTLTLLICFLSLGGLISTDIFLPALKDMGEFYNATPQNMQSSIAIFLLGISITQLIYGPITDSLGRKKVLLFGLFIWFFSTISIYFSQNFHSLMILRLLQGIGACAGITISRAIISDLLDKKNASLFYLTIFPFVGMSPAIAPVIGGVLSNNFGWKSSFLFLTIFILLTIILSLFILKETLPKEKRIPFNLKSLSMNTIKVLKYGPFLYYSAIPCFAYAIYFAYIVESPFILISLGLSGKLVGYSYLTLSLAYVLGNVVAKRLVKTQGVISVMDLGYKIFFFGGISFGLQMYISPFPVITSILTISILTFGNGFLLPLGTASAIGSVSELPGIASGIMGCMQIGSAAASSYFIGIFSNHDNLKVGLTIAISSSIGIGIYRLGKIKIINRH